MWLMRIKITATIMDANREAACILKIQTAIRNSRSNTCYSVV